MNPYLSDDIEKAVTRLPRKLAYPLIFAYSVFLWSMIGLAFGAILRNFTI